ncbi:MULTISPECIES: site-specific integrase [Pseudomonas]|uniref:Site-specific integrase n=2 Tax=Pseudomonas TaxID=286 RepID=A0ABD4Y9P0_9PSED|nr:MULTISPECIES: site-specific integrase [Pseudomonas]EKU1961061.1 site-specific integrase [Pseudomonas aeruginosa]EKV3609872.1 site-specific integrase [Pseudomonas aeruginosa]EKW6799049.1 site-specific integrase [Pseudomonas aeruginosa]EMB2852251.1 site-specific integrase [Pseudomonas aeruginosa]KYO81612.1 Tyrosine recombinase XerC [Pseudomonas aeruginosa]
MTLSPTQQASLPFSRAEGAHTKKTVLLDGRLVDISIGEKLTIHDRDGKATPIHLDALQKSNPFHESLFDCFSMTLATHSLSYNSTVSKAVRAWLEHEKLSGCELITLKEISCIMEIQPSYRAFIIPILRRIKEHSLSGLSDDVSDFLENEYKWEQKGGGSYYTLITNDPEKGALTNQELHSIHLCLNEGYANRYISQHDFTLCWFFIGTGVRPVQVARMTRGDVIIHDRAGMEVTLRIPLAKGEGVVTEEYWIRKAPTVLAECLITYLDTYTNTNTSSSDKLFRGTPGDLGIKVTSTLAALPTYSERLEGPIHITAYRFRYTMATRALAQGASDAEVARLLTHRSTSCIQFYRASMPQLQKPIRQALGKEMDYFASAFQGRLIEHLDQASRAGDDDCVIADYLRLTGETLGACGTRAECHQHAPIACLSCPYFEPLIDAPWETLMVTLIEDQEVENDPRIQQINVNAMAAIQQIIVVRDSRAQEVVA